VYRACDDMAHEHIHERVLPAPRSLQYRSEPRPENTNTYHLHPPLPASTAGFYLSVPRVEEEAIGEPVEVEAREGHDDVEEVVLDAEEDAGCEVEGEDAFVIRRVEVRE
jgi:hypothetical protein